MLVRERCRFLARELVGGRRLGRYTLRDSGVVVHLRHGTPDIHTFDEIFYRRLYDPPAAVDRKLKAPVPLAVLDLGANIGLAGAYFLARYPSACVVAVEPEPANAAVHRLTIAANDFGKRWRLVEAAAGRARGKVSLLGAFVDSRVQAQDGGAGDSVVDAIDVLDDYAGADLAKIDIEGSEWDLLGDDRFPALATAIVLEYHPEGCSGGRASEAARDALEGHGFVVTPLFEDPRGHGMLWGVRD